MNGTNTTRLIPINKNEIVKRLSNECTMLDDYCINDLLYFITTLYPRRDNRDTVALMLIDSLWVERYMSGIKKYRKQLRPPETLMKSGKITQYIIPLNADNHWSLLVRVPRLKCWFHFDSIAGYHYDYALAVSELLDKEVYNDDNIENNEECGEKIGYNKKKKKVMKKVGDQNYEFIYFKDAPTQKYGWECGIYLLMYGYAMIHFNSKYNHEDDPNDLFRYLKKQLPIINESKRKKFVSDILALLKSDVH